MDPEPYNLQIWQRISSKIGLLNWYFMTNKQELWRVRRSTSNLAEWNSKTQESCCWGWTGPWFVVLVSSPNVHYSSKSSFFLYQNLRFFLSKSNWKRSRPRRLIKSMCVWGPRILQPFHLITLEWMNDSVTCILRLRSSEKYLVGQGSTSPHTFLKIAEREFVASKPRSNSHPCMLKM